LIFLYFTTSTLSSVATQLRCGISNHFIKNVPQNVQVKNRSIFGEDMNKSLLLTFLPTVYTVLSYTRI